MNSTTKNAPQKTTSASCSAEAQSNKISSFRDLIIWQRSMAIAKEVYAATKQFPREELYGLTSQLRRCSVSVPSNIAEGFKRWHKTELKQFLNISAGSLAELETQILLARSFNYIDAGKADCILKEIFSCEKMISKFASKY
ncbi:MAG TPA: four helix bundle protein [Candidatus Omnitrophica bacterium]|nr:four helix bundle protein [Candidatus Omnitrophota bacterium]